MTELILPLFILQRVLAARVDNPCWGATIIFFANNQNNQKQSI